VPDDPDIQQVLVLETRMLTPAARKDRAFLDEVIADEFFEHGASGRLLTKSDVLREMPAETGLSFRLQRLISADKLAPEVVAIVYVCAKRMNGVETLSHRFSHWRRIDGAWKLVYHRGTTLEGPTLARSEGNGARETD
jgi:hypothetical protein